MRLGGQLFLVCAGFAAPLGVMLALLTNSRLEDIRFGEKERVGVEVARPLVEIIGAVSAIGGASDRSALNEAETQVNRAVEALARLEKTHGQALRIGADQGATDGQLPFSARTLGLLWLSAMDPTSVEGHVRALRNVQKHALQMLTHVADQSNLILDPDLDSYYLMDMAVNSLPEFELHLGEFDRLSVLDAESEDLSFELRVLDSVARRSLRSLETARREDARFYGSVAALSGGLEREATRWVSDTGAFVDGGPLARPGEQKALEAGTLSVHRRVLEVLDTLLVARISKLRDELREGLTVAGVSVLFAAAMATWLGRRLRLRVRLLETTTRQIAEGNLEARVPALGSDELGQLALSFNQMTNSVQELTNVARERSAELARLNSSLETKVLERTTELRGRNEAVSRILDNVQEGLFTLDLFGRTSDERSRAFDEWFQLKKGPLDFVETCRAFDPSFADNLSFLLEEVRTSELPPEVTVAQLPMHLRAKGREFVLRYRPIMVDGRVHSLLVVLTDETDTRKALAEAELQQETLRVFQAIQTDREGFLDFMAEGQELVNAILTGLEMRSPLVVRKIHTLKGTSAVAGALALSRQCHELEGKVIEGTLNRAEDTKRLEKAWATMKELVLSLTGGQARAIEIADEEYLRLLRAIAKGVPRKEILVSIAQWKLESTDRWLKRVAEQATKLAARLGKTVKVTTLSHNLRVRPESWSPLWAALTHVLRNAIDHGIESPGDRMDMGKPEAGHLELETTKDSGRVTIRISDDGRGIDWERVRVKAKASGLPATTQAELINALFSDGVSTRDTVTEISGRGVGLAEVRQICEDFGGTIQIETTLGQGTTFLFEFPEAVFLMDQAGLLATLPANDSLIPALTSGAGWTTRP